MGAPDLILVPQPDGTSMCGQACVATVVGCSLREAVAAIGITTMWDTATSHEDLISGLHKLGIETGKYIDYARRKRHLINLPDFAIMGIDDKSNDWGHWVVLKNGWVLDPGYNWHFPVHIYEEAIIGGAFSRRFSKKRDARKENLAYWGEVIPIIGRKKL